MQIDLNTLTLKELKALQADVMRTIHGYDDRRKREALSLLEAKARELGFDLNELLGAPVMRRKRSPAVMKFADPNDPSQVWSGRGRKPRWFAQALAQGKTPEDLSI